MTTPTRLKLTQLCSYCDWKLHSIMSQMICHCARYSKIRVLYDFKVCYWQFYCSILFHCSFSIDLLNSTIFFKDFIPSFHTLLHKTYSQLRQLAGFHKNSELFSNYIYHTSLLVVSFYNNNSSKVVISTIVVYCLALPQQLS